MKPTNQKLDFKIYKKFYQSIGSIPCPYFGGEKVVFNRKGFNHFFWAGRNQRPFDVLCERISLLPHCKYILEHQIEVEYRVSKVCDETTYYWGFMACVDNKYVKLVVRQIGKGQKHFFSVFPVKALNTP